MAIKQDRIEKAAEIIKAAKSQDEIVEFAGKMHVRGQHGFLCAIEEAANQAGRGMQGTPSLGDHIITQQAHRIAEYKDNAYKLSERQIAVIVRENWDWIRSH